MSEQFSINWAQGYAAKQSAFIDNNTICQRCGHVVKFTNVDGSSTVFRPPLENVALLAVHPANKVFAVAESDTLDPKILVYDYPWFNQVSTLEGAAEIDITYITFSTSEYLCSTSGVPDFNLTLWNYVTGEKLCAVNLNQEIPSSVSFDPTNWRHICMTAKSLVYLWTVEQCDQIYLMQKKVVKLPGIDVEEGHTYEPEKHDATIRSITRASIRTTRMTVDVPKTAITGLVGKAFNDFENDRDKTKRVTAVCHTWNIHGDVYVGCQQGHLMKLDFESQRIRVLLAPIDMSRDNTIDSLTDAAALAADGQEEEPVGDGEDDDDVFLPAMPLGNDAMLREAVRRAAESDQKPVVTRQAKSRSGVAIECLSLTRSGLYIGLGEPDGILRLVVFANDGTTITDIKDVHQMPNVITDLSFNLGYNRVLIGCESGRMDILSSGNQANTGSKTLFDTARGKFVGVVPICGKEETTECVSVRQDGTIQVWSIANGSQLATFSLGGPATAIAAYPLSALVAVASGAGFLFFFDLSTPSKPRIIHRIRLFDTEVKYLQFDARGKVLIAAADGTAIVLNAQITRSLFEPLGYLDIPGKVQDGHMSWDMEKDRLQVIITSVGAEAKTEAPNRLTFFELGSGLLENPLSYHVSLKCDFRAESMRKMELFYIEPKYGCFFEPGDIPRAFGVSDIDRCLESINLPEEPPKKASSHSTSSETGNKASFMAITDRLASAEHEESNVRLTATPNNRLVATYGVDGIIRVLDIERPHDVYAIKLHDDEGVSCVSFVPDGSVMLSCSGDGSILATTLKIPAGGLRQCRDDHATFIRQNGSIIESESAALANANEYSLTPLSSRPMTQPQGSAADSEALFHTPTPQITSEHTWLQIKEMDAQQEEDRHYSETKKEIRRGLRDIKRQIQDMVETNNKLPDLEKLDRQEFELDVEEQAHIVSETDTVVQKVREDIEFQNLAKQFTLSVIKRECWDNMMVKGRAIVAFNSAMEVDNFPMKARTKEEEDELQNVKIKRQIEMADGKNRRELIDSARATMVGDEGEDIEEDEAKDQTSLLGSSETLEPGAEFGGGSELAYSQFDLHTRQQKIRQIVLLQDSIYRIKEFFNKEFGEVFKKKELELAKVKDKNVRIRKILEDLDLLESQPVVDPIMTTAEKPELLLIVEDHEVTVEKYLTPEQRKKLEEERLAEEERRRRERADNWRERGLDEMMGGVLEVKKEDELKKDIPKPAFMLVKPEEEWNEEEKKMALEYERKVKELNEEREKYRKQLESELKKLTSFIDEGKAGFDETLLNLFHKKIKTQMAILQEELKIWRLRFDLVIEEEMRNQERDLLKLNDDKRKERDSTTRIVMETRKIVDNFRENYDILSAEDKVQEKNFKREFSDLPGHYVDQLFKLYKRRPRRGAAAHTPSHSTSHMGELGLNPYAERPSSAKQHQQQRSALEAALIDMDNERNMPDGIELSAWRRLCKTRRDKIEKEQGLKQKALDIAEMNAFLQRRQDEEEMLRSEQGELDMQEQTLREDRRRFETNLQVQLLLKQGQVEVEAADGLIYDFSDSILIHRSVVEDHNTRIRGLGEAKVQHMMEGKDFKKRFIHLEWELKKMTMEVEDLRNKAKDIQSFKISREVQRYLNSEDYDGLIANEIQKLEQAMGLLKRHHERTIDHRSSKLKHITNSVSTKMDSKNVELQKELTEKNVSLNERIHIDEVTDNTQMEASEAVKRYRQILQRQKLVDLAKAQAKEVAVLRAEVERLRMRTFPALVQNK